MKVLGFANPRQQNEIEKEKLNSAVNLAPPFFSLPCLIYLFSMLFNKKREKADENIYWQNYFIKMVIEQKI